MPLPPGTTLRAERFPQCLDAGQDRVVEKLIHTLAEEHVRGIEEHQLDAVGDKELSTT